MFVCLDSLYVFRSPIIEDDQPIGDAKVAVLRLFLLKFMFQILQRVCHSIKIPYTVLNFALNVCNLMDVI